MSSRIYGWLLRLYPRRFRERYGPQLLEAFGDRYRRRTTGRFGFWVFHSRDFARSLIREHADELGARWRHPGAPSPQRREHLMHTFWQDVGYALRNFRRNPGFTMVVLITLGMGIGLNSAIFSVVNGVLLQPLPFDEPDRLIWGFSTFSRGNNASVSPPDFLDYRRDAESFEHLAARRGSGSYAWTGTEAPRQVFGQEVSAGFFEALGAEPILGRGFSSADETEATHRVVVLSHGFWQREFGGEAGVLDRTLTLDGEVYEVVGVMPAGFALFATPDFWTPIPFDQRFNLVRRFHNLRLVGRLAAGVSIETAQTELDVISARLEAAYPESNATWRLVIQPLHETAVGYLRPAFMVLSGAVALVLLIVCGNVANLLLARGAARHVELAIRSALGASRSRVVRQLFTESMVLAVLGGALGIVLAFASVGSIRSLGATALPRIEEIAVSPAVLGFALVASLTTGLLFGLVPSVTSSRADLSTALRQGGRDGGAPGGMMRALLVSVEVALSLVLLVGSGLLLQSFRNLTSVEPGFDPSGLLVAQVVLPQSRYDSPERRVAFLETAGDAMRGVPGVGAVAVTTNPPLFGSGNDTYVAVFGRHQLGTDTQFNSQTRVVSANYFDVMDIPLVRGRGFQDGDRAGAPNVVIINEPFASTIFPDENPIGQRLQIDFGDVHEAEIVGVVGGVNHFSLSGARSLQFYLPQLQNPTTTQNFVIRAQVDPTSLIDALPAAVAAADPLQPVATISTYDDILSRAVSQPRYQTLLFGLFAAVAVLLAAVGIYGVLGYYVTQRTQELGVRVALGAGRGDLYRLVVGRGMVLTAAGLVVGLIGSFALTRLMTSLLFGIGATDAVTFVVVPAGLAGIALAASIIPARRAANVDPMIAVKS